MYLVYQAGAAYCLFPSSDVVGTQNIQSFVMLIYARIYLLAFNVEQDFHTTPASTPSRAPSPSRLLPVSIPSPTPSRIASVARLTQCLPYVLAAVCPL